MTEEVTDNNIQVRSYGSERDGPPLTILHGGPGAAGDLADLAPMLARKFKVLEPLQRRSGQGLLNVDRHVEDLKAVAPQGAHLLGHSWGAMLALSFAAEYSDRLSSLILVSCGTYDETTRDFYRQGLEAHLGSDHLARLFELETAIEQATDAESKNQAFAECGALIEDVCRVETTETDDDSRLALQVDYHGYAETWQDVLRRQEVGLEPACFESVSIPVLMIYGEEDPHPGAATKDLLSQYMPQIEYLELSDCGHYPWRERFGRGPFLAAVDDFISQN